MSDCPHWNGVPFSDLDVRHWPSFDSLLSETDSDDGNEAAA